MVETWWNTCRSIRLTIQNHIREMISYVNSIPPDLGKKRGGLQSLKTSFSPLKNRGNGRNMMDYVPLITFDHRESYPSHISIWSLMWTPYPLHTSILGQKEAEKCQKRHFPSKKPWIETWWNTCHSFCLTIENHIRFIPILYGSIFTSHLDFGPKRVKVSKNVISPSKKPWKW